MITLDSGRKPCYFCGTKTVRFKEHYVFCPECSVIYTHYMKYGKTCEHIIGGVPNVLHNCWFKDKREAKPFLIKHSDSHWKCSKCQKLIRCDGW